MTSLLASLVLCAAAPLAGGENFVAADGEFVRAAEAARVASAQFWTGTDLPGRWSSPCPIEVQLSGQPAAGRTTFLFDRGEGVAAAGAGSETGGRDSTRHVECSRSGGAARSGGSPTATP